MAAQPGSISSQPAAAALTGGELLPLDQEIGSPVAAAALEVGRGYRIVSLGTTNWQACGAGAGAAVGTIFTCEAVGAGTGTAQRVDTRRVTAQAIASLAGSLYAHVKNASGGALVAGTSLRITGTVGDTTTLEVVAADATSSATMPALLVLNHPLASNAEGHATMMGEITGVNTSGMAAGAPLFVPVGGGLVTATRPASNAQQVATVGRVHASTGSIHVLPWPVHGLVLGTSAPLGLAATASAGSATTAAPLDHQHQRDTTLIVVSLSGDSSDPGAKSTVDRWVPTFGGTIISATLDCETAITGTAFIVNATLNNTGIFSTKPQIGVGETSLSNTPVLSITSFNAGDVFRFGIDQAGGGGRLAKMTITIRRA